MTDTTLEASFTEYTGILEPALVSLIEDGSPLTDEETLEAIRGVAVKLIRLEITGEDEKYTGDAHYTVHNGIRRSLSHAHLVLDRVDSYLAMIHAAPERLDKANIGHLLQARSIVFDSARDLLKSMRDTLGAYAEVEDEDDQE